MNNKEKLEFIKNFYENISDDDLKKRLEKAGFEIVEGIAGKILVDDQEIVHIENPDFTITTVGYQPQINGGSSETFSINYNLGATA